MKIYFFLILIFGFNLSAEISWQADLKKPFVFSVKISPENEGFITLDVELLYPSIYDVDTDSLLEQLAWSANPFSPQLQIQESSVSTIPVEEGIQAKKLHVIIRAMNEGPLVISFLNVSFLSKDPSASFDVATPVFTIPVLPSAKPKIPPLAPLMPLEPKFPLELTEANRNFLESPVRLEKEKEHLKQALQQHAFPWLAIIFLLGAGAIGWVAYLTKDLWPKAKEKPPIPPLEQAKKAFEAIRGQVITPISYSHIAAILINFLKGTFGLGKKELTTSELMETLDRRKALTETQRQRLLYLFSELDQIKFAGKISSQEKFDHMKQEVELLIQDLKL